MNRPARGSHLGGRRDVQQPERLRHNNIRAGLGGTQREDDNMIRRRSFAEQDPILVGLGILFALAFVVTYWPVFLAACAGDGLAARLRADAARALLRGLYSERA
jgi:hypothetical protein